jgi:acyl-homoserine lactone acylase PvdQ
MTISLVTRFTVLGLAALPLLATAPSGAAAGGCIEVRPPTGASFLDCSVGQTWNILPPGQNGLTNAAELATGQQPPHSQDQLAMYADLEKVAPNLQTSQLAGYYKPSSFTLSPDSVASREAPRPDTVILRDKQFGVPHIYGRTRYDTEFGAGYAAAEDRLFMMDVLRHVGRSNVVSFLGLSPSTLALDCGTARVAGYDEGELQQQVDKLTSELPGPYRGTTEGAQVIADGHAYVDGVNAYIQAALTNPNLMPAEYAALQVAPLAWKPTDIVAVATIVQAIFATGGGNEVESSLLLSSLQQRFGQAKGRAIWSDLRSQNDPAAPTTIATPFPYGLTGKVDPNATAWPAQEPATNFCNGGGIPDTSSSPGVVSAGGAGIDLGFLLHKHSASNALVIGASKTASGHPIAVFGPQVAYFAPEILHEEDLHGPGIDARGASFPGTDIYVELGRGVDYAWSATSAGSDIVDERVEQLCNVDGSPATLNSTAYVYNGVCRPMYERTDVQVAKPTAAAPSGGVVTIQIERTVHGPVVGRTMALDPANPSRQIPVAISYQRSTWFDELGSAAAFMNWNDPGRIRGPRDFIRAAGKEDGTFNWFYVDASNIAYFSSGKLPLRAPGVDPSLPSWGTGGWEWTGFAPLSAHPQAINPAQGWMTNWNNKPAPQFSAADSNFAYGPVYRVQSLSDRVRAALARGPVQPVDIVNAMEDAGSVDLDGSQLVQPMASALAGYSLTAPQQRALSILDAWAASGSHRRESASDPNAYDQGAAVAIMDDLYPRLTHAVFDPWLTASDYSRLSAEILGINDPPGAKGSAYDGGWEGFLQRAFRQAVNPSITAAYSQSYCGNGSLATCQRALQAAIQATIDHLTQAFGNPDPASWSCRRSNQGPGQCNPAADDIQFSATGLDKVPNIPWINRPTFQQVVQYAASR